MCFHLKKSDIGKEPKIAEKDIIVYKIISKSGHGLVYSLKIDDKLELWTQGYIYSESDPFDNFIYQSEIEGRCFHSCKTLTEAKIKYTFSGYNSQIVKMIIPKGSKYYVNYYEYVSDTIYYPLQDKKMNLL